MGSDLESAHRMYREVLTAFRDTEIPFMIGGAYALGLHTGIHRETKDLDLFILPCHSNAVIHLFRSLGYPARMVARHWLAKIESDDAVIDIIFGFRNGVGQIDERWFQYAREDVLLGQPVKILAAEEMIWSKAFVMERDRYDGADISHLIRGRAAQLDWQRLLERFGPHWLVLLNHLVMFSFIYPGDRHRIPQWLVIELTERWRHSMSLPGRGICRGTLLSFTQYGDDVDRLGLQDARLQPIGPLLPENLLE